MLSRQISGVSDHPCGIRHSKPYSRLSVCKDTKFFPVLQVFWQKNDGKFSMLGMMLGITLGIGDIPHVA